MTRKQRTKKTTRAVVPSRPPEKRAKEKNTRALVPSRPRMSEAATSGNVAVALTDSNGCGRQWIPKKVCAKITHNRDLVAH